MGLPKIIQIPCHHVLANQNALKFKKGAPLKQFFNINLGIGLIKKLLILFLFWHISMCFYSNFKWESSLDAKFNFASNEYPQCIILMDPTTPKTKKYRKKRHHHIFFRYYLSLGYWGLSKVCSVGTCWMWN